MLTDASTIMSSRYTRQADLNLEINLENKGKVSAGLADQKHHHQTQNLVWIRTVTADIRYRFLKFTVSIYRFEQRNL